MDGLLLFRDAVIKNYSISVDNSTQEIIIGDRRLPSNYETALRSDGGKGQRQTLETLWFALTHAQQTYQAYFKEATDAGVGKLSFVDRNVVVQWLRGQTETIPHVEGGIAEGEGALDLDEDEGEYFRQPENLSDKPQEIVTSVPTAEESGLVEPEYTVDELEARTKHREAMQTLLTTNELPPSEPTSVAVVTSSTLDEALGADRLQALRKMREMRKTKKDSDDLMDEDLIEAIVPERSATETFLEKNHALVKKIQSREIPLKTSDGVLQESSVYSFEKITRSVAAMRRMDLKKQRERQKLAVQSATADVRRQTGANRYAPVNEENFLVERIGQELKEFEINPSGSWIATRPVQTPQAPPAPTFTTVGDEQEAAISAPTAPNSTSSAAARSMKRKAEAQPSRQPKKPRIDEERPFIPIIIAPSASLINVYNAVDKKYAPWEELKKLKGIRDRDVIRLNREGAKQKLPTKFEIIDNPLTCKGWQERDWDRVVAVFVVGAWQFKRWKWSSPAELFGKVKGYYFMKSGHQIPADIKSWNVKINEALRHRDAQLVLNFWNDIDEILLQKQQLNNKS